MKSIKNYISEKFLISNDYDDAEEYLDIDALTDKIIENFDIKKPGAIGRSKNNGVVSKADYIYLSDAISGYLNKHNVEEVHARNITFHAVSRCISFLPKSLQDSYLAKPATSWPTVDIDRLYITYFTDGTRRGDTKFIIYATDYWDGILIFKYWKPSRNIVWECSINI